MRKEWILVSVFLVIWAFVLLRYALSMPEEDVQSVPQTAIQTTVLPTRSRYAVNVNEATFEELMGVKGMSEKMAQGILDYRAENGRFYTLETLLKVPGFGKVSLEKVRPYLCAE